MVADGQEQSYAWSKEDDNFVFCCSLANFLGSYHPGPTEGSWPGLSVKAAPFNVADDHKTFHPDDGEYPTEDEFTLAWITEDAIFRSNSTSMNCMLSLDAKDWHVTGTFECADLHDKEGGPATVAIEDGEI